ncbi:MAG: DUF2292 domain-containing protein [Clostridia bacterium]|nr:MAG: DUF2292 domain-containing protein [Clostridia bacterium]
MLATNEVLARPPTVSDEVLEAIIRAISEIRHGTVTIVIQDSRVVQIDKTEKIRLR